MSKNEETDLNISVMYDETTELITTTFSQNKRLITIGFDLPEAQAFSLQITKAITEAILGKLNITLPPPLPETRH